MIRAASTPRYSDLELQQLLERLANGTPGAVPRPSPMGHTTWWKPTLDEEIVKDPSFPMAGFRKRGDAVRAARSFKAKCEELLAEPNGSA
jgi:hypothetical protein